MKQAESKNLFSSSYLDFKDFLKLLENVDTTRFQQTPTYFFRWNLAHDKLTLFEIESKEKHISNSLEFFPVSKLSSVKEFFSIQITNPFFEFISKKGSKTNHKLCWRGKLTEKENLIEGFCFLQNEEAVPNKDIIPISMLSGLSKNVRAPLLDIFEQSAFLKEKLIFSNQEKSIGDLNNKVDQILIALNEFLDQCILSNIDIDLDQKAFTIKSVVNAVERAIEPKALKNNFAFSIEYGKNLPYLIIGDRRRFIEIVSIFTKHAIQNLNQGFLRINLNQDLEGETDHHLYIKTTIQVLNNNSSSTYVFLKKDREFEMATKLVTLLQGSINKTETSTLEIKIPFLKFPKQEDEIQPKIEQKKEIKVLLADDDTHNQFLMEKIFEKLEIEATIVSNGQEVIQELSSQGFDLVILDIEMPVLNGFETIAQIRSSELIPQIPVWALTSHNHTAIIEQLQEAKFDDFIPKPLSVKILKEKLDLEFLANSSNENLNNSEKPKTETFSLHVLNEIGNNDEDFVTEMLKSFETDVPEYVNDLAQSIENKDVEQIKFFIHKLKSPFHLIGHTQLEKDFSFADNFERANNDINKLIFSAQQIEKQAINLVNKVKDYLNKSQNENR